MAAQVSSAGLATHHYASPTPGDPGYPAHAARVASGAPQAQGQGEGQGEGPGEGPGQVQGWGDRVPGPPAAVATDPSGSESEARRPAGYAYSYTFAGGRMVNALSGARGGGNGSGSGGASGGVERHGQPGARARAAAEGGAPAPAGGPCLGPGPSPAPQNAAAGRPTALPGLGVPGAAVQLLL